jgi:hypothetical protein
MAGTLPIKNANNLKIYFNNSSKYACQLTRPLKFKRFPQSQARKKSHGQRQLSSTRTTKPPRNQASKRPVIPFKGEVMNQIGENKKKQRNIE